MKLFAYTRDIDLWGNDIQKEYVQNYIKDNRHKLVAWYEDKKGERTEYNAMLCDIKDFDVDGIIYYKEDFLCDTGAEMIEFFNLMEAERKDWISVLNSIDTSLLTIAGKRGIKSYMTEIAIEFDKSRNKKAMKGLEGKL